MEGVYKLLTSGFLFFSRGAKKEAAAADGALDSLHGRAEEAVAAGQSLGASVSREEIFF